MRLNKRKKGKERERKRKREKRWSENINGVDFDQMLFQTTNGFSLSPRFFIHKRLNHFFSPYIFLDLLIYCYIAQNLPWSNNNTHKTFKQQIQLFMRFF